MIPFKIPRNCLWLCMMICLALISVQPALAQGEPTQLHITQVDTSKFPKVTVYISATGENGEPVGVDASQIQLSEDGKSIMANQISAVGEVGALTTLMVMDVSGSMNNGGKLEAAKQAARAYVGQMRPGDQAGLISFNTSIKVTQPVTADHKALDAAIDNLTTENDTAMFDALMKAIEVLKPIVGRKAIIVLTDGLDNSSTSTSKEVLEAVGNGDVSISTIGLGNPAAGKGFFGLDEATLRDLAAQAGGVYAFTADNTALQAIYQAYGRALQSEYGITYTSPSKLRDGINRMLMVSFGKPTNQGNIKTKYNPGGVLPEVQRSSPIWFGGILAGLIALIFLPGLAGRLFRRNPGAKKSRIRLK
jgi:Ca-activated chloride channel homolog